MLFRSLTAAAFTVIGAAGACSAKAADLGKPATVQEIIALPKAGTAFSGCYGEVSTAGTFLAAGDRLATGALGGGCTVALDGVVIVGGGIRADFGNFNSGAFTARAGVKINPHLMAYGLADFIVPDWKLKDQGKLAVGAGAETSLGFADNLSAFVEATSALAKLYGPVTKDDVTIRGGIRVWLK